MMKWGWDFNRREGITLGRDRDSWDVGTGMEYSIDSMDKVRISIASAENGKVIQISRPVLGKNNSLTGDRDVEMYVVADGQSLMDVFNTILTLEDAK